MSQNLDKGLREPEGPLGTTTLGQSTNQIGCHQCEFLARTQVNDRIAFVWVHSSSPQGSVSHLQITLGSFATLAFICIHPIIKRLKHVMFNQPFNSS